MNNKKRRLNDVSEIDDSQFLDQLDQLPYLYRSIQAINWINLNPLKINKTIDLPDQIEIYLKNIFEKFFSNIGFGFIHNFPRRQHADKTITFGLGFLNKLPDGELKVNFSTFIEFLNNKLIDTLIEFGIIYCNIDINIESGILFYFSFFTSDSGYNLIKTREINSRQNELPENILYF